MKNIKFQWHVSDLKGYLFGHHILSMPIIKEKEDNIKKKILDFYQEMIKNDLPKIVDDTIYARTLYAEIINIYANCVFSSKPPLELYYMEEFPCTSRRPYICVALMNDEMRERYFNEVCIPYFEFIELQKSIQDDMSKFCQIVCDINDLSILEKEFGCVGEFIKHKLKHQLEFSYENPSHLEKIKTLKTILDKYYKKK